MIPNRTFLPIKGCLATSSRRSISPWLTAPIGSPAIECDSSPTKYIGRTCPTTAGAATGGGTTGSTSGVVAGSVGSGVPAPVDVPACMFDGNLIFMSTPPNGLQAPDVVLVPPLGRAGISRCWQDLAAAWNFALVSMLRGKIGPLPEKFGLGS